MMNAGNTNLLFSHTSLVVCVLACCLLLAACGGNAQASSATPTFNAQEIRGREVYEENCANCHSTIPNDIIVGPSFAGVATRAAKRVRGLDAREYITQSILEPRTYIVEGYPENLMPLTLAESLSEDDREAVVAYLLTLEE